MAGRGKTKIGGAKRKAKASPKAPEAAQERAQAAQAGEAGQEEAQPRASGSPQGGSWENEEAIADDVARPGQRADGLPRGNRPSRVEAAQRLAFVEGLVAEGRPRYEIIAIMLDRFGMPTRTADRYLALAWEALEEQARQADPQRLVSARIARLTRLSRSAERAGDMRACARFEQLLIDVTGTRAPTNVNLRGAIAHAHVGAPASPLPDLRGLSDEELDLLERATTLVKAATPALPAPVADAEVVE